MIFSAATGSVLRFSPILDPLSLLGIGLVIVLGLILGFRFNAFLALILAAFTISFLAGAEFRLNEAGKYIDTAQGIELEHYWEFKIKRVLVEFGKTAGNVGFLIIMGAIIGKCMMESRAADRIVLAIFRLFGEKRVPASLLSAGFVLSIPVFYDTTFYLLAPLARSCFRRIRKNYVLLLTSIGAGATITHSLVPPTPGPLITANEIGVSIASVMLVGSLVGLLLAPLALLGCYFVNWYLPNPRIDEDLLEENEQAGEGEKTMPSLFAALFPIFIPVVFITCSSVMKMLESTGTFTAPENSAGQLVYNLVLVLGNANIALLLAASASAFVMWNQREFNLLQFSSRIEAAIIDAGLLVMITSAGGAFGAMLRTAGVGRSIQDLFTSEDAALSGTTILLLSFAIASLMKTAQGSSTAAMITASSIIGALALTPETLGFHPAYVATAIGLGAMVTGWMNDSGFWVFCRIGGIHEIDAMKTWTVLLAMMGFAGMGIILVLIRVLPLASV